MSEPIRVGIVGYGNLGRGVKAALQQSPDMKLSAVFTRRPDALALDVPVMDIKQAPDYQSQIDVMILCGGSANDLPEQGPHFARLFDTVDSFDTHPKIPAYFASVDAAAREGGHLSLISSGWDPGLFSLQRIIAQSVLPQGATYTFWGKGVSQGHSNAVRRIKGVADAVQYSVPIDAAVESVRRGETRDLTAREKHRRVCYVVPEEGADLERIKREIVTMPDYFAPYDTEVHFISAETMKKEHRGLPHGGLVIHNAVSGGGAKQRIEFELELESNPEFTASVMVAYARAVAKMAKLGVKGALSVFDIPPAYLSPKSGEQLRKELL